MRWVKIRDVRGKVKNDSNAINLAAVKCTANVTIDFNIIEQIKPDFNMLY